MTQVIAKSKETDWFPPEIKPVRKGVYRLDEPWFTKVYAYWNGRRFGFRHVTPELAYGARQSFTTMSARARWRGLAEKP